VHRFILNDNLEIVVGILVYAKVANAKASVGIDVGATIAGGYAMYCQRILWSALNRTCVRLAIWKSPVLNWYGVPPFFIFIMDMLRAHHKPQYPISIRQYLLNPESLDLLQENLVQV